LEAIMTWRGKMQWTLSLVLAASAAVLWHAPASGQPKGDDKER
jgi:hypothetical protein